MPSVVSEVDAFTTPVQVPNDGEGATKASLLSNFVQALTNRTKNILGILNSGVPKVRLVADLTALKALSGMTTGESAIVFGIGLYTFDGTTTPGSDTSPWIIKPGAGSGQWVHTMNATRVGLQAAGFSTIKADQAALTTGTSTTSSTSLTDAAVWVCDITGCEVGDKILVDVHFGLHGASGTDTATVRPVVVDDFGGTAIAGSHAEADAATTSTSTEPFSRHFVHVVAAAGTSRVKLQFKTDTGTASIVGNGLFRYQVIRSTTA